MRGQFDVLVVGGGTAGCVLAARLSEDPGRSVCLLEAGPDYGPYSDGRWPDDLLDARTLPLESHCWPTDRDDRSQLRARVLGGCSAHNACVALRGTPADYDEWGPGWSHAELEPCLERAERALGVRTFEPDELTPWSAAWAEAAARDGDAPIIPPVNVRGAVRWNAAFAYLDAARSRPNLTIRAGTLVDCVLIEGDRARGVVTTSGEVGAALVVLAAGAYGSPAVLLRSGLTPERGRPVGEGLADHCGSGVDLEPTDELQRSTDEFARRIPARMTPLTIPWRSSSCDDDSYDVFLFPTLDPGWEIGAAAYAMKPEGRGRVSLMSADPAAPVRIEHPWEGDERAVETVAEGLERLRELAASEPVRPFVAGEIRPGPHVDVREFARATMSGFSHPVGTCAMGAVTDAEGRVAGVEGLRVADASIMPTIPRANTNLTTAAIAERVAELLGV